MSSTDASAKWWDFISHAMDRKGMTAADLAQAAGYNASTLSHWKSGRTRPTLDLVRVTAKALDVNYLDALLASGLMTIDELKLERVLPDLSLVSDEDIMAEAARRMVAIRKRIEDE